MSERSTFSDPASVHLGEVKLPLMRSLRPRSLGQGHIEIRRMWSSGPLRLFCSGNTRPSGNFIPYASKNLGGYAGSYVCESCRKTCDGVYRVGNQWLGGCCRKSKEETAE